MSARVVIAHLYPDDMNIYGDVGNVIALRRRLEWRGIDVEVRSVEVGSPFDFAGVDIVFGGGGQDSGQQVVAEDLLARGDDLRSLAAGGTPMLVVCGTYQLFGSSVVTADSAALDGIGIFGARTVAGASRLVGNIVVDSPFGRLVGFENHSGQTILDPGQDALGTVTSGFGNDRASQREGARTGNVIGTYLHGPVLPKNPHLTDHLLRVALERRCGPTELAPIPDDLERRAADSAAARPR
ncbi:MAG TPA: glutamine amidotransferase [Cellulomonas sp.]|uniref:type 1 glutamine amidotransferase n=1 Tax=Cellulomonas sp. TaxID=40001 RepID=UPI002E3278BA|nr:glutamine amidotransferase [Cellulomonas sp.]HEX5331511.1 glutamine amidotransferase [Cellulomonas sp.]